MAEFLNKTFVATDGTSVPAHDSSWSVTNAGEHTGTTRILSNRVSATGGTGWAMVKNSAVPPSADYEVSLRLRKGSGDLGQILAVGRYRDTGAGTPSGYAFSFSDYGFCKLLKYVGGGIETLVAGVEVVPAFATNTEFTIRLRMVGNVISGYLDDSLTPFMSYTDTASPLTLPGGVAFTTSSPGDAGVATIVSVTAGTLEVGPAAVLTGASGTKTGPYSSTGQVTTDGNTGTLFGVATTSTTKPSKAQVAAGQDHTGAMAPGAASVAVTSAGTKTVKTATLAPSAGHYWHFMHRKADLTESDVVTSAAFTTDAAPGTASLPDYLGAVPLVAGANSVTVPAGTKAALVMSTWWHAPAVIPGITSNFGDFAVNRVGVVASPNDPWPMGRVMAWAEVTATGARTLTLDASGYEEGPGGVLIFLDNVVPADMVVDAKHHAAGNVVAATVSMRNNPNCLIFGWDAETGSGSVIPALASGWTNGLTQSQTLHKGRMSYRAPAADPQVFTSQSSSYRGVIAFAIQGVATAPDTDPPTLSGSITETGKTESSISISWPAGADNVGVVGYDVSRDAGSTWSQLGNVLAHTFSGLSAGTEYQIRVRARDGAGLTSTPALSTAITTTAPDTTDPTLTGSITVGVKTATSIAMSWPAGSDNVGVTSYEVSSNAGSSWADVGNVLSHQFTGLAALTSYGLRVRAKDGAGLVSTPALAATTSTYPAGASGAWLRANPESFMAQCVEVTDLDTDWFSWESVTPPASGSFVEGPYANGTFVFEGPSPASMVIKLRKNNVVVGDFTVTLYDQVDTTAPTLTGSITISNLTSTSYDMQCPVGADNVAVTGYEFSLNGGTTWTDNGASRNASASSRTPSSTDQVRWRCYDAVGLRSTALSASVTLLAPPDVTLPTLSGSITITNLSPTSYDMQCPAGSDNVGVTGYEFSLNGGTSWTNNGNSRTASATSRTPEATDQVRWRCYDAAGNRSSALSAAVTLPALPDTTSPTLTGSITVSALTHSGYSLSWPVGSDNVAVTGYDVSLDGGTSWDTQGPISSRSVSGRASETTDQVRVRARDAAGNTSTPVLSTSVTLLAAPDPLGLVPTSAKVTQVPTRLISRRISRAVAS